jgi:hypothetical protein
MRQLTELQASLTQLLAEYRKQLAQLEAQYAAMKKFDINSMFDLATAMEATRLRLITLDDKRKLICHQIATACKLKEELTVTRIIELFPPHAAPFVALRKDLREVAGKISKRTFLASKLSCSVVGHLNTALRLLSAAVERAGLYTRNGVPRGPTRIGVMDAVG